MNVLFIGGSGIISSACSALAVERGIDLTLLNRGRTDFRPVPAAAHVIHADIRDPAAAAEALRGRTFDAVVDWIAFTTDHVAADLEILCRHFPLARQQSRTDPGLLWQYQQAATTSYYLP